MSLGIKSFATEGVSNKNFQGIHDGCVDSRWVHGFTMGAKIQDGFLDSRWVPAFTIDYWIHDMFWDQASWLILVFSDLSKCFKAVRSSECEGSLILVQSELPASLILTD